MNTFETIDVTRVAWHISTRSDASHGNCVEAGPVDGGSGRVAVRHSHHPRGDVVAFSRPAWQAFVDGLKA